MVCMRHLRFLFLRDLIIKQGKVKSSTYGLLNALMSRNAHDDKNGRFGERAPQLTMLAKLVILAIFCQFRQIC